MVCGIVEQSEGYITVDSELGQGTTFKLHLPRTDRAIDVELPVSTQRIRGGLETILLVEDEDQVSVVATESLRGNGHLAPSRSPRTGSCARWARSSTVRGELGIIFLFEHFLRTDDGTD